MSLRFRQTQVVHLSSFSQVVLFVRCAPQPKVDLSPWLKRLKRWSQDSPKARFSVCDDMCLHYITSLHLEVGYSSFQLPLLRS